MSKSTFIPTDEVDHFPSGVDKQSQPLVCDQRHDVALALNGPQLERKSGTEGMRRRDHLGAGKTCSLRDSVDVQADQFGNEEEESSTARREGPWSEGEVANICDRLFGRPRSFRALLIQSAR